MQDALAQPIELDAGFAQQGVQAIPAVQGEPDDGEGVAPGAARQALDQELQPPRPLMPVGAGTEQQGGVLTPEPVQDLAGCARVGPGFRVADRNLAAIGEAGLQSRRGLAVDDSDGEAGLPQVPGAGDAGEAGAENDNVHDAPILSACGDA